MSFLETPRFPDDIAEGSQGGPGYSTSIVVVRSGQESRNVLWSYPRHEFDVAYGVRSIGQLESLIEYFHAVGGMAYGFRYKDFADFKSCRTEDTPAATDQVLETDDFINYQLIKTYTKGSFSRQRVISKPVDGTVLVAVNDVPMDAGSSAYPWSVDTTTGIITFDSGVVLDSGDEVSAGYEFDVPVRFDTDRLVTVYEQYLAGSASVPLIEIRDIS